MLIPGSSMSFHVQSGFEMARKRIDLALVDAGLVESRTLAQRLIMAGQVRIDGQLVHKASQLVTPGAILTIDRGPAFVSRGGEKLRAALDAFPLLVTGAVCSDVGASTGGFTDCLLQNGAARIYAIDVGRQQLHWKLRQDDRVISMESTNVRYLGALPEPVDLVTIDVSFISLRQVLPVVKSWLKPDGQIVALVKPQFEAGRREVKRGGVVRNPTVQRRVVAEVIAVGSQIGLYPAGLLQSPLKGPKGNLEYLLWLRQDDQGLVVDELLEPVIPMPQSGEGMDPVEPSDLEDRLKR
jgi:23S rRNA (cytidine1920-2'-O)/16S rRNA (cytidine1409-2'-O)-methyltransferase